MIRGKLCRWVKPLVYVHITPIVGMYSQKEVMYSYVEKALQTWNNIFRSNGINLQFSVVSQPAQADIVVHWVKVGRTYEGMCKYLSVINDRIMKISIDIGLPNEYSGKETTDLSIYCAILHEFGHSVGLGHGVDADDIMYVPHQKNISVPSENDLFVLKEIYKL